MTMMDISILLLTILLFGHNKVVGENTTATAGDYTVEVLGQSGKINLKQVSTGKRILQVSPDSLDEYENAADTKVVGKHSFSKFPTEDFMFSTLKDDTLYNASVKKVTFTTTITSMSNAEVSFDMYLFMENKTITVESGEEYEVKEGSVKFNVNIK